MYRTMEEVEDLGLRAEDTGPTSCDGCAFYNMSHTYKGVHCTSVPCTPGPAGEGYVIWVKRESPEQG